MGRWSHPLERVYPQGQQVGLMQACWASEAGMSHKAAASIQRGAAEAKFRAEAPSLPPSIAYLSPGWDDCRNARCWLGF